MGDKSGGAEVLLCSHEETSSVSGYYFSENAAAKGNANAWMILFFWLSFAVGERVRHPRFHRHQCRCSLERSRQWRPLRYRRWIRRTRPPHVLLPLRYFQSEFYSELDVCPRSHAVPARRIGRQWNWSLFR